MAFWIELNPGAGGDFLAADLVAGIKYQITKIGFADAGNVPVQVASDNPLPVAATFAGSLPTGGNIIGAVLQAGVWQSTQAGTWTVQPGNVQNTTPWLVTPTANPGIGGSAIFSFISAASVLQQIIKASAGSVYSLQFFNSGAAPLFARLYDSSVLVDPTVATPVWRGIIPGNSGATGFTVRFSQQGIQFNNGIVLRCTAQIPDSDNSNLPASTLLGNTEYL